MSEHTTQLDYPVSGSIDVTSREDLIDALRTHHGEPVRLLGSGSAQDRVPAPTNTPRLLRLASMDGIARLEPDDLTCSVEPGLPRATLDATLAEHGLWLPCAGTGTLGGMFAGDLHAPMAPGAFSPRSLLLGIEGVLAEGLPFKAGARVVKSVAGFDLQKLFVGSLGRLFAVTMLHLKLRPRPRALVAFATSGMEQREALARFSAARRLASPPLELWLERSTAGYAVRGALAGDAQHVESELRALEFEEAADAGTRSLAAVAPDETVAGLVRPSRLAQLLSVSPDGAPVLVSGTGQFEIGTTSEQSDALLARCPEIPATAVVHRGAPERRGQSTAIDVPSATLSSGLREALDPAGMLQ